jgi:two-component system phosphate regulon sensor histidine kinase PhoR
MSRLWITFVGWQIAVALAGALIGAVYGQALAGLALTLLAVVIWHLINLYRLERWLADGRMSELPFGNGLWARVFARITFVEDRSRVNRMNFRQLVKEIRASTKAFPDGGIILNAQHEIINYNKPARRLLGLKKKRDRGQRIENLIRHPDFIAYMQGTAHKAGVEIPAPINGEIWLGCRLMPYGPDQSLLLIRDITQRYKLEAMRRDFVANASHELRSPLTVIAGYLDALEDDRGLPETWTGPIGEMRKQSQRMSDLVRDLLTLSKLESSAAGPLDKAVDLAAILASARKDAFALERHPQSVELLLDSDAGLLGEETEIRSVVSNLVSNAIRYTPENGTVKISWRVDDAGGHLSVEDTGIGIAAEDIPRLTERFFRVDGGRARQQGGTGLGLAIVKHALKRHDAELEIKSRVGQGSIFTCHFSPRRVQVVEAEASTGA